jgi:hypothetical protein
VEDQQLVARLERVSALDSVALAQALSRQDRSWGTEVLAVAGGYLVLSGPGLYVNRGRGVGIAPALGDGDLALIESRCAAVGVPAAVEVTPATDPATLAALAQRGYVHDTGADVSVFVRALDDPADPPPPSGIEVDPAPSIEEWQEVSALGWGHTTAAARRAADAFARAAHAVDGEQMVIAYDVRHGRPLGCASMSLRDGVATLGGMSTIPAERGRGVQGALILHRLELARSAECDLATTATVMGGASERNVQRYGFELAYVRRTFVRR